MSTKTNDFTPKCYDNISSQHWHYKWSLVKCCLFCSYLQEGKDKLFLISRLQALSESQKRIWLQHLTFTHLFLLYIKMDVFLFFLFISEDTLSYLICIVLTIFMYSFQSVNVLSKFMKTYLLVNVFSFMRLNNLICRKEVHTNATRWNMLNV